MPANVSTPEDLRVGIIEDQQRTREGLKALIDLSEGFACVGAWRSMEEVFAVAAPAAPEVILLDLALPGVSGIEGLPQLRERFPNAVVVVLTVYEDDSRIFDALCAGASGYLLKNTRPPKLLEALREAKSGGAPMSPHIAKRVVELFRRFHPPERAQHNLTPHELRLLKLLVEGHSYKSAATELKVSVNTIAFHVQNIYTKLQVHSKSEAVARALRERLLD